VQTQTARLSRQPGNTNADKLLRQTPIRTLALRARIARELPIVGRYHQAGRDQAAAE
jgi:hypothetical protein